MEGSMSVNQDIYDRQIDHAAMVRLFEENAQTDTKRIIRKHKQKLRKLLATLGPVNRTRTYPAIKLEVNRFIKELGLSLGDDMKDYGITELDFNANNLAKSIGAYANVRRPRATGVLGEIVGVNIRGEGNLSRRI